MKGKKKAETTATAAEERTKSDDRDGTTTEKEEDEKLFYGQCLERQLYKPKVPYPAWDYDWDSRMTPETTMEVLRTKDGLHKSRRLAGGTTRHILLVRHGQYDETYKEDDKRRLTPLGRKQAEMTGLRLSLLHRGGLGGMAAWTAEAGANADEEDEPKFVGPCTIKAVHVSDMTRAKETADLIARHLPDAVARPEPDPLLNEALPAPMIPARPDVPNAVKEVDEEGERIERAFRKYVYRSSPPDYNDGGQRATDGEPPKHEFEVIVGHGNVIRYFVCRALQLPPEAWLRMAVFNCSLTYIMVHPNGYVSVRCIGDTGHLPYDDTTFSGYHGYKW